MPKLFSDQINDTKFRVFIPEYYLPSLPDYFRNHKKSGYAMINGVPVSDEEYTAYTGEAVERDTFIPTPIYIAAELNMCMSSTSVATIVDMTMNQVPFKVENIEDIPRICEILQGYYSEMGPYIGRSAELKAYTDKVLTTHAQLQAAYNEIKRDIEIRDPNRQPKKMSLLDFLKQMK